tara:strand:+ start:113 stop:373 length:261 start_codon:yes stop_codon:yes gene_type:complete
MAFECNIDARGKAIRMKLGIRLVFFSLLLASYILFDIFLPNSLTGYIPTTFGWFLVACVFFGGMFTIWEARMGWCIVRAMGFKTKI